MSKNGSYSAKNTQELLWHEHIRLRPGMYIGQVNINGFVDLLKGVLSNVLSHATDSDKCIIELSGSRSAKLTFCNVGREIENDWELCRSDGERISFIGMATLNALCRRFEVRFLDDKGNQLAFQKFRAGILYDGTKTATIECSEWVVEIELDELIWGEDFKWNELFITHRIREFAYLYKNARFELKYKVEQEDCRVIYHFKNGLKDRILIESLTGLGSSYLETYIDEKIDDIKLELAFAFREYSVDEPYLKSYVNDHYTHEEGTHVEAVLKGLTYAVMRYFQKHKLTEQYRISEKGMREHLIAALNIRLERPQFSGCVRNKLANSEIIEPISAYISEVFYRKLEKEEVFRGDATNNLPI